MSETPVSSRRAKEVLVVKLVHPKHRGVTCSLRIVQGEPPTISSISNADPSDPADKFRVYSELHQMIAVFKSLHVADAWSAT